MAEKRRKTMCVCAYTRNVNRVVKRVYETTSTLVEDPESLLPVKEGCLWLVFVSLRFTSPEWARKTRNSDGKRGRLVDYDTI